MGERVSKIPGRPLVKASDEAIKRLPKKSNGEVDISSVVSQEQIDAARRAGKEIHILTEKELKEEQRRQQERRSKLPASIFGVLGRRRP
ncbi:MAG: hypothetical protein M1484_02225 [Patescibacteria group bacterium]|nr:hypothetical protein [Patescibacteria group bacterium]